MFFFVINKKLFLFRLIINNNIYLRQILKKKHEKTDYYFISSGCWV